MIDKTIGHYRILEKVGEGGMGVVYKAQDTKLNRIVALKFLPERVQKESDAKQRFIQEAQAAASLNHPNICTIHGVEEVDNNLFMVMEYVEGGTLREKIPFAKPDQAVEIAIQIGEALQEAHEHGIVHRDVKADNIMLAAKGQAKVMDFGLAKLKGALKLTRTSSTVGTLAYMAPEQIEGGEVDHKSDIFSFGVLLFEMLSGHLPFRGEHEAAMLYSIVNEEPQDITQYVPDLSPIVVNVIQRCLEKDPNDRFHHFEDITADLRRSQKKTSKVMKRPGVSAVAPATEGRPRPIVTSGKKKTRMIVGGIVIVVLVLAGVAVLVVPSEKVPFQNAVLTPITTSGNIGVAEISQDGKFICYTKRQNGKTSLRLLQIATSKESELLPLQDVNITSLTFSSDGEYIYYKASDELYRIPFLGGTPLKVLEDMHSGVTFSPDGKRLSYRSFADSTGEFMLIVANSDGTESRIIASRAGESWYEGIPSWSPHKNSIVVSLATWKPPVSQLVEVDVDTKEERIISPYQWGSVGQTQWTLDGTRIILSGWDVGGLASQIFLVTYPSGEVYRVTNAPLTAYVHPSRTNDASVLCVVQHGWQGEFVLVPGEKSTDVTRLTDEGIDGRLGIAIGQDREIYFVGLNGPTLDIFATREGEKSRRQVTSNPDWEFSLSLTPDGKSLLYRLRNDSIRADIWQITCDGSGPRQITTGGEEYHPVMGPKGRWIYVLSWRSGAGTIMKAPAEGGDPIEVSKIAGTAPLVSSDGETVFFVHGEEDGRFSVYSVPATGGAETRQFALPAGVAGDILMKWRPQHNQFSYIVRTDGVDNIWVCSLNGAQAKQYTAFTSDLIANFAWMPDGVGVVVSRGRYLRDIVLIRERESS